MITITDQFCGAGGSSIGATETGAELRVALNHWQLAIDTHNTNFPNAMHDCTDISACNPRRYPSTDILITSPECTNHSLASGKRRPMQDDLFGNVLDPAEERSRATMWDVPRFAEYHRYNVIIVENVVDARLWVNWTAWLLAMRQLGYEHKSVFFNSMHAYPTPQSRDRMYVVFWRKGNHRPDLNFNPVAWCSRCNHDVAAVQAWKNGNLYGRYRQQYVYSCPHCASTVEPYYSSAATVIDWSLPAPRIGDRKKPLKSKTMDRIRIGLERYGRQDLIVANYTPGFTRPACEAPLGTVTTTDHHALVVQVTYGGGERVRHISQPMPTQTTRQDTGLVMPYYTNGIAHSVSDPLQTITTVDRHALIAPVAVAVEDCGFRMLQPHEIQAAMAFPAGYRVLGTKREQVRQLGNAVTPPVMRQIVERVTQSLQ